VTPLNLAQRQVAHADAASEHLHKAMAMTRRATLLLLPENGGLLLAFFGAIRGHGVAAIILLVGSMVAWWYRRNADKQHDEEIAEAQRLLGRGQECEWFRGQER
jgi:hypothetical protein